MSAILIKGHSFVEGGEVNAASLHDLIGQATMAGLDRTNMDIANFNIVSEVENWTELEALEAGVEEESFWLITQLADGSPASMIAQGRSYTLWEDSPAVLSGHALNVYSYDHDTSHITARQSTINERWRCMGVSVTPTQPGDKGIMIHHGIARVDTEGTNSVGDTLAPSPDTAGVFHSEAVPQGIFEVGRVISTHGVAVWAILNK
jgi:hypothetical protein